MITKAVIALILFGLTSSANAMTVIFKDYKAAYNKDEKAFYLLYLDGVREGITELNVVLEEKRQQPLFCLPDKLALTVGQDGGARCRPGHTWLGPSPQTPQLPAMT